MRKDTHMRAPRPHLSSGVAVIVVTLALLACGFGSTSIVATTPTATAVPTATATPAPSASVIRVVKSQFFADSKSGGTSAPCANGEPLINGDCGVTVTAACAGGDVIISGGFAFDDFLAFVTSSYPSSPTAWTVTAHDEGQDGGSHPVTVTVYADCLHANFDAGVSAVSSSPSIPADSTPHEVSLACPSGTVVTGGGFRSSPTIETIPAANGWTANFFVQTGSSAKPALVALCASKHLAAGSQPNTITHPLLGTGVSMSVACPAGQLLVGGGAHTIGFGNITSLEADSSVANWLAVISRNGVVGGPPSSYTVMDYAVCVTVS
jgi:hypothetical protein